MCNSTIGFGSKLQIIINPIPIAEHFRRSHPQCEHSHGQHIIIKWGKYHKVKLRRYELNAHANKIYNAWAQNKMVRAHVPR